MHKMLRATKSQRGMTLIEIMVVVAIIAGITGLIAVNVVGRRESANIDLTRAQIADVMKALDIYKVDNHRYPSSEQGLNALVTKPSVGKIPKSYPQGGYIKKVPKDTWGTELSYSSPGAHGNEVEITSAGPDEEEGTDDDINSWDMDES